MFELYTYDACAELWDQSSAYVIDKKIDEFQVRDSFSNFKKKDALSYWKKLVFLFKHFARINVASLSKRCRRVLHVSLLSLLVT